MQTVTFVYENTDVMTWQEWSAIRVGAILYLPDSDFKTDEVIDVGNVEVQAWYHQPLAENLFNKVKQVIFNLSDAKMKELENAQVVR